MICNLQRTKAFFVIIAVFMGFSVMSMTYIWLNVSSFSIVRHDVTAAAFVDLHVKDWPRIYALDSFRRDTTLLAQGFTNNSTKSTSIEFQHTYSTTSALLIDSSNKSISAERTVNSGVPVIAAHSQPTFVFDLSSEKVTSLPASSTTLGSLLTHANGQEKEQKVKMTNTTTKTTSLSGQYKVSGSRKGSNLGYLPTFYSAGFNPFVKTVPGDLQDSSNSRPDNCTDCFSLDFRFIISPDQLCDGVNVDLLIVVLSSVTNREARDAIRSTWGTLCNKPDSNIRLAFVIGNNVNRKHNALLLKESNIFHDIIQADFRDSYANLTYKTMTGLKWSQNHCSNAKFVMKTDDDMFVNTEVLPILLQAAPHSNFIGGFCWGPSSPHRDTSSKWYVSYRQYGKPFYPAMCSGTGYLVSSDVVEKIVKVSRNIPFFYLEDVYVALCVNKIGLTPVSLTGFSNEFVALVPCVYRNFVITSHRLSPETLTHVWTYSRTCALSHLKPEHVFYSRRV